MDFNNFLILFLIFPLIILVVAEIYEVGKQSVFPIANQKVKKHNYSRLNFDNLRPLKSYRKCQYYP